MEHSWSFQGKGEWIKSLKASPLTFKKLIIEWFYMKFYFLSIKSHPGFQSAKLKLMIYLLQAPIKNTIHNLKCDFVKSFYEIPLKIFNTLLI